MVQSVKILPEEAEECEEAVAWMQDAGTKSGEKTRNCGPDYASTRQEQETNLERPNTARELTAVNSSVEAVAMHSTEESSRRVEPFKREEHMQRS